MGFFRESKVYSRADALANASKAQGKGKRKQAIAEYQKVLEHEPDNAVVNTKVAVLHAESRQFKESWKHFVAAAETYKKQGFDDKALAVYVNAVNYMPREVELWLTIAAMQVKKNRPAEAVKVLLDGRRNFNTRTLREFAMRLLSRAFEIEPWNFEVTFDLAGLEKGRDRAEAGRLLEGLAGRVRGWRLRKVRGALFRLSPTPGNGWRWLRAAVQGR